MANHLGTKWTDWKPFPDPAEGGFITAPLTWIDILFVAVVVVWLLLALRAFLKEP